MKTIKNFLITAAVGLIGLAGVIQSEAGQPVVWTLNLTNASLISGAISTVTSNGVGGSPTWASGGIGGAVSTNYVDTLQSSTGSVGTFFNFTPTGLMVGDVNNTVNTFFVGSQDLLTWTPWTNCLAVNVAGTSNQFAGWIKFDLSPFRYIAPSAIVYSVTNGFCTNIPTLYTNQFGMITSNSQLQVKFFLKGP